ncbi:SET domain-containing protein [Mycena olivaceomarginata]|nr:SET domain-containing protein [Mycena olivaceomarginata]
MNAASEPAPGVSSSSTSSERDFVAPSDDESSAVSASSKPLLRRSSRRSSSSVSVDPLDFLSNDRENASISRGISPDDIPDDSLSLSPMSDHFFDTIDETSLSSVESTTATQYPIITWQSYKQDLKNFQPTIYYARDLVSKLHDYIHSFDPSFRMLPHMRHVFENAPWIEILNDVDDEPAPPWEFYYSNKLWVGEGIEPSDMSKLVGCDCIGRCDPKSKTCSCLLRQKEYSTGYFDNGFAYDNRGRVKTHGVPIFECNSLCACDNDECKNRVVQHGRQCHIAIKKTADKGWGETFLLFPLSSRVILSAGVFATRRIPKGTFIGVYAGEFLRDDVCERRGLVYDKSGRTYLLNNDWYYLQGLDNDEDIEYTVDAYHAGNNHSCDPNCKVSPFYIDEPDIMKSTIALFSSRDVPAGEELCFAYDGYDPDNPDDDEAILKGSESITKNKCFCGAARCRGYMFG